MTFEQILTDIGAGIAAIGMISTILAHLPFLPPRYAEFFARISLYAANWKFSVNQRPVDPAKPVAPAGKDDPPPPPAPSLAGVAAFLLALGFAFNAQACIPGIKPKTVNDAALILCDVFFAERAQTMGLSPKDVEKALCATAEQIEPFLASAKMAASQGGAVALKRSSP